MGLDRRRLKTLFYLRGRLTLRQFSRERGRIVSAVLITLIVLPLVLGASAATVVGYWQLPDQWPGELLGAVLTIIWFVWLIFPVIFSSINEGLDITRLLVYPLPRRELVVSVLLGTLFDYPTYLMLPLLLAVLVGWGGSLTLPVVLLALLLTYAHAILIGQLVITAVGGVLQSRRFRDLVIVVGSLLGVSCYFIQVGFARLVETVSAMVTSEQLSSAFSPLAMLQWLPTGAAARAIERASAGLWGESLLWLGYSAVLLLLLTWVWWRLLIRLTTGEGFLFSLPPRPEKQKKHRETAVGRNPFTWLPADVAQLTLKELRSVWRTPNRRVGILQMLLLPAFFSAAFFFTGDDGSGPLPAWFGLGLPVYALFNFWAMTQNMLGWEGSGLTALLVTPVPRHRIFLAKGLALTAAVSVPYLVVCALVVALIPTWYNLLAALTGLVMGVAGIAVTAVFSALFPIRMNVEGKQGGSKRSGGSCQTTLVNFLLLPPVFGLVTAPPALPLALAYWRDLPWLGWVGLLLSAIYATIVFWYGMQLAGRLLLRREAEVVAALRQPHDE
jgi:ABC-2 type transport system permease protein